MMQHGFVKVGAATPRVVVGDPLANAQEISRLIQTAAEQGVAVVTFPELSLTGYTCGDLFLQQMLLDGTRAGLEYILQDTGHTATVAVLGMPIQHAQRLYNCAVVIQGGQILGIVPKTYLPNYKEFYEQRWFTSGFHLSEQLDRILCCGHEVPFGNLVFSCAELDLGLGVEICEDLWSVIPPSSYLALHGANLIVNPSASNELVAKTDYRRQLIQQQSARCLCGYVYASAGVHESTTDTVYGGEGVIAENGTVLATAPAFQRDSTLLTAEVDLQRMSLERQVNSSFSDGGVFVANQVKVRSIEFRYPTEFLAQDVALTRPIAKHPFIPAHAGTRAARCEEIFNIQVAGLAKRLEHTGLNHVVIGISGGLDSTLALLVAVKTMDVLQKSRGQILAVTMPGFGTTDVTYTNALELMQALGVTQRTIDIKPACLQHFADIGHNPSVHDVTYENVQARERTQILMDLANKTGGLVVGTGDLSEIALGWSTYNGDHMSMYAVNCGVPKTLVKFLIQWVAEYQMEVSTQRILQNIIATPISPELLPPDSQGQIVQKTEDMVGPYELHDFYLYYAIRFGMRPDKVLFLAEYAFAGQYAPEMIKKWLVVFYRRFFSQQFKRSCLPDGPKVGTLSLSPRGDWRMPSDAVVNLWLQNLS